MEDLFGVLFVVFVIFLIIGLISPNKGLFWLKKNRSRKAVLKFYGLGAIIAFFGFGIFSPNPNKDEEISIENVTENAAKVQDSEEITDTDTEYNNTVKEDLNISYEVLRQWNPNNDNDAIGLDILIDKKDATKENILILINQIAGNNVDKANILIFTTKNAWKEGQRGSNFTNDYKKSYIAFYVKNNTGDGAYSGFNEIRWMQEIGALSNLYGSVTKL
ncbi:hypothetical protein [Rufibacter sp. LB8]|uniref:hypothetical protein n=1 Tax=Rufibacter sp. LB8 TaxID=2777781 RepID=UPI00178C36CD|nr:hypothetical protein [Rufibacter sp. LB8]